MESVFYCKGENKMNFLKQKLKSSKLNNTKNKMIRH